MKGVMGSIAARVTSGSLRPGASRVPYTGRTLAGVTITPDSAVTIPAVWRGLGYLSQTTAILPWHVMKPLDPRGSERAPKHFLDYIISERVSSEWSSFQFRETLTHWALRWGNGYAEIEPDQAGRPFALHPIHPERVKVCRAEDSGFDAYGDRIESGNLFYEVIGNDGAEIHLLPRRMFHIRGFGEGPVGVNVIHYAAESLGWGKAVQLFGSSFFGNGANIAGVIINKKSLKEGGIDRQQAAFDQLYKGPRNAHKTAVLDNDADWKAIGVNPKESQLTEVDAARILDVCRWLGVPPHKVMDLSRAHYKNLEQQSTEVVSDSIMPWTKRFEDEANYKLFGRQNRQRFFTQINLRGLLKADFKSQNEALDVMRRGGAINADEWRDFVGMNPMPPGTGGDLYVMQSQNVPLTDLSEDPANRDFGDEDLEEDEDTDAARQEFDLESV